MNKTEKCQVAIKAVPKYMLNQHPKLMELFKSEIEILKKIKNQNVVGFIELMETSSTCYIVLEYCNEGDLESFVQGNKG
jgi:serine/threonine protein kinase